MDNFKNENIFFDTVLSIYKYVENYKDIIVVCGSGPEEQYAVQIVKSLSSKNYNVKSISFLSGEEAKTLNSVKVLWDTFSKFSVDRSSLIISVGGGALSDAVGFAASTYMRGVHFATVPTTLLAMIDASIGAKRAINFNNEKNIIGSFYPSEFLLVDISVLSSLDEDKYSEGLVEGIKLALVEGNKLYTDIKNKCSFISNFSNDNLIIIKDFIKDCIYAKQKIVSADYYDKKGIRASLNYGHTLAHAMEKIDLFHNINHGLAVALGMDFALYVSQKLNFSKDNVYDMQNEIFVNCGIVKYINKLKKILSQVDVKIIYEHMCNDKKKFGDSINFVLLKDIGMAETYSIPNKTLYNYLLEYKKSID